MVPRPASEGQVFSVGLQSVKVWADTKPVTARTADVTERVEARMVELFKCFFLGKSSCFVLERRRVVWEKCFDAEVSNAGLIDD